MVPLRNHVIVVFILVLCKIKENKSAPRYESYYGTKEATASKFHNLLDSIANVNEQRLKTLKHQTKLDDKYYLVSGILRHADDETKRPVVSIFLLNNNSPENSKLYEIFDDDDPEESDRNIFQLSKEFYNDAFADREEINKKGLRNLIGVVKKGNDNNVSEENDNEDNNASDGEEIVPMKEETNKVKTKLNKANNQEEKKKTSKLIPTHMDNKEVLRIWKSCSKKAGKRCTKACKTTLKDVCKSYKCSKSMKRSFKRNCKSNCKEKFTE